MDTNSAAEAIPTQKPKRRIWRILIYAALAVVAAGIVAHFAWKYSGSNRWTQVGQRKGVVVYAMKSPGSTIEKFKAVWNIHCRLSNFAMWVSDEKGDTKHSMHKEIGLYDHRILGKQGDKIVWSAWKQPLVKGLEPREFVIRSELSQDPKTRILLYTVTGTPDKIPPNDCCVRVPVMNNSWTLTPLQNGDVHVEWIVDMDIGGVIPYALQNKVQPGGMLGFAQRVQLIVAQEKYKNARYDWLQD